MNGRYSKIQSSIWTSEKFKSLKGRKYDFVRLTYMYLLSCPFGNSAGLYRLEEEYALVNLSCTVDQYHAALQTLRDAGLIEYEGEIIFVRQFLKFNPYTNEKHAKGSRKEITEFKDSTLYTFFYEDVKAYCADYLEVFTELKKPIDSLLEGYQKPIDIPIPKPIPIPRPNTDIDCAEQSAPSAITLTLNDSSEYPVTQKQIDGWKPLYPGVDIIQQLRNMKGWLSSNPKRRKTKSGILRFITGWLAREQDRGRASPQETPSQYQF